MPSNRALWGISAAASAIAGVATLFVKVKHYAVSQLSRQGAFDKAREERIQALQQIHSGKITDYATVDTAEPHYTKETQTKVNTINKRWQQQRRDVTKAAGAGSFSGSWKILSGTDRAKAVGFAAVNSIAVGAMTRIIGKYKGKLGGADDLGDAFESADFGHHSGGGGGFNWHADGFDFGDFFDGFGM